MRRQSVKNTFDVWGDKLWKERERQTSRQWNISDIFFEQEYGLLLLLLFFFWREKDERRQLMDTAEKRAINWTETRSLHSQHYLTSFFLRARVSVSLVPGRSLLIRCPREVSVTSQRMVESRNDRAENAWRLGWGSRSASLSPWIGRAVVTGMHMDEMTFLVQNER